MEIDRALVKSQAKQLIKGKVFKLFIISFIVSFIVSMPTYIYVGETLYEKIVYQSDSSSAYDYFKNFGVDDGSYNKDYFDQFKGEITVSDTSIKNNSSSLVSYAFKTIFHNVKKVVNAVSFFMLPLIIGLYGLYLQFVNGREFKMKEGLNSVFSSTFNSNYIKKLGLVALIFILEIILTCLFIVPGVIFALKYIFARFVMAENPDMSVGQAMRISKKITDGHKGELFILKLSFVGWILLSVVTLGIANIFVIPYVNTVVTLYYENFKRRAFTEMRVNQFDFMTPQQKAQCYYQQQQVNNYQNQNNNQSKKSNTDYYNNVHF